MSAMIQYRAMNLYAWSSVNEEQLNPLLSRKVIHAGAITVARLQLLKYAVVPTHSHASEQITMLERGALKFIVEGQERIVRAGDVVVIPPHAPHSVEALEDSAATDLFSPPREDWRRGDDSYLRGGTK